MTDPVEVYLSDLRDIRSSGAAVPETSYYPALANLLNAIGKTLKPKVRCIINPQNRGAGIPDGGLFTPDQFQKASAQEPPPGQLPSRGVIEVKSTAEDAWVTADGKQVSKYWGKYRQVLVTNYRDFVFVGQDPEGQPAKLETYRLAAGESQFWQAAAHPQKMAHDHGERLTQYLKRVMLQSAPLASPQDVAWFLASYARDARSRVEEQSNLEALASIRTALEEALGLKFEGEKGEHFFRSTLVQTLFYGLFSAWVLWSKRHLPTDKSVRFNWHEAAWLLHVPMIRALFEQFATPSKLGPLGLEEVLDWAAAVLNRVDRTSFFGSFEEAHAVQYFYEPFLQAFDPELRKDLGVWYTPPEIVQYMVARVDTVLREELHIPDGLADPCVYVLDPCCGTGAYLVEILKRVARTLRDKGEDALAAQDVKRAARERVFGFEIMPAPFVISHLQVGLLLQNLGAPLYEGGNERAAVYLTNALTGWEPAEGPKKQLPLPEMEAEREAADEVKRERPVLVILGNPPYNAFAGVSPKEEQGLVQPYKEGLISEWGIKKFNLDDLYIRFFRLAERRIAEMTGRGVVSYISNHSWITDPSFVAMRKRLLASFDRFWIENMHGNRKISEYAPDGKTSETIFAIAGFSVGIQQGVAISLWVKSGEPTDGPKVLFRDDLNAAKAVDRRAQLLQSLGEVDFDGHYESAHPEVSNRFSLRPSDVAVAYLDWPRLVELCAEAPSNGLMEKRKGALIDADRALLEKRIRAYYDPAVSWETLQSLVPGLTQTRARFEPKKARLKVLAAENYSPDRLRRYAIRPLETVCCYYSRVRPLWNEPRPSLWAQCWDGNAFLLTRFKGAKQPEGVPSYFTRCLSDDHILTPDAVAIPFRLRTGEADSANASQTPLFEPEISAAANLSPGARSYLATLEVNDPDGDVGAAELIWMHALAIGYSPAYLTENADGIRQDWPRIPLPHTKDALLASAALGRQVAALLDTEHEVPGVSSGAIRGELKPVAVISRLGGGSLNPGAGDLAITAGWGHAGKGGVTMPAKGRTIRREYPADELAAIREGAEAFGLTPEQAIEHLGETTLDIYLNDVAYWRNVPARVWDYTIGGYQVVKKWLSYRERELLGRSLTEEEARYVTAMARRIAAILLLEPALDANYHAIKDNAFPWNQGSAESAAAQ